MRKAEVDKKAEVVEKAEVDKKAEVRNGNYILRWVYATGLLPRAVYLTVFRSGVGVLCWFCWFCLMFYDIFGGGKENTDLTAYTDSDGMTTPGSKPVMGYLFQLGKGTVHWSSKRAGMATLSVTEAEITALAYTTQEVIYLKRFINEVLQTSHQPIKTYCDNAAVVMIIGKEDEQKFTQRNRHFEYRKDFFKDYIKAGYLEVLKIKTEDQLADILTKSLSADKVQRFTRILRLV